MTGLSPEEKRIKKKKCCRGKGVPETCLGLCMKSRASNGIYSKTEEFTSVCYEYEDVIENCVESYGNKKYYMIPEHPRNI